VNFGLTKLDFLSVVLHLL